MSSSIRTLRESTAPRSFPLNPLEVQQDLDVIKPLSYDSKTAQYRVSDMEGIERILQFILNSDASKYFCPVHPLSVPLVLLEPALTNTAFRDAVAEILFDSLECPSLFFAKQPALAAFGCGRMSAAVYDSGFSRTTTSIVVEGYVLPKSVVELGIGGDFANKRLASIMGNANPILSENVGSHTISRDKDTAKKSYEATTFCPFFAYSSQPPYHPQRKPFISDSYWQWGLESTMESIRRECCAFKVADTTTSPRAYTLPDGSCISTESFGTVFPELFAVGVEEAGIPSDWIDPEVLDRMASYQLPNCGWMAMLNS